MEKVIHLKQYTLPVDDKVDFTSYSYFVSQSNHHAYELILHWPQWTFQQYVIVGPSGYGKTHLGYILKDRTNGTYLDVLDIQASLFNSIQKGHTYIIDNLHHVMDSKLLFHFYNLTMAHECYVVYLSQMAPGSLDTGLLDLNSRLRSLPVIELSVPDDELCRAVIQKIFSDLQTTVSTDVIDYLVLHTSRNLTEIQWNLKLINQRALEDKRNITIPFIKLVL